MAKKKFDNKKYKQWVKNLPSNLRGTDTTTYNLKGAFQAGLNPIWNEEDKSYHLSSIDPTTGNFLKSKKHSTTYKETDWFKNQGMVGSFGPATQKIVTDPTGYFGEDQLKYIPIENFIGPSEYKYGGPTDPPINPQLLKKEYLTTGQINQGEFPSLLHLERDVNNFIGDPKNEDFQGMPLENHDIINSFINNNRKKASAVANHLNRTYPSSDIKYDFENVLDAEGTNLSNQDKKTLKALQNEYEGFRLSQVNRNFQKEVNLISDNNDPLRHLYTSGLTSKNIADKIKNIPYVGKVADFIGADDAAGFIGANLLGAGHEINGLINYNDLRPFSHQLIESGKDMYNNFLGAYAGVTSDTKKEIRDKVLGYVKKDINTSGKYKHGGLHNSPTKYELIAERTKDKLMQYDPEGNSYFSVHPSGSGPTFQSMYPDLANEFNIQGQGKNLQIPYSNKSILDSKNISSIPNAQSLKIKENQIPEPPKNLPFKVNKPKLQSKRIKAVVNTGNIDDSKYDGNKYTDVSFYEYDPNTGKKELVENWKDDFKDAMAQPIVEFTSPSGEFIRGGIEEVMDSLYNADINNIKYDQLPTAIKYKNVPPAHTEGIERELKYGGNMKQYKKGGRPGLWANIHAKRNRIKAGSKEKMRTPGSKGAPTAEALKRSQATYGGMLPEYGVGGFLKGALSGVVGSVPIIGGMMQEAIGVDPNDKSAQAGQMLGGIGSKIFNPVGAVGSALKGAKAVTDVANTAKNTTGLLGGFKNLFSNGSANLDMIAQAGGEFMPEVDYEAEGGEVIVGDVKVNRAYNGGTMKSYKGGGMHLLSGPKHSAGGIGIMQFGGDSSYVFSDSKDLKVPKEFGKFNTFADAAKSRSKSLEDIAEMQMGGEIYDRKTADLMKPLAMQEFSNLFDAQEQFKADNGIDNPVRSAQNGGVQFGELFSQNNIFQPEETGAYMKANTDAGGNPFAQFITSQNKEREINVPISSYAANQGFNRDKNIDLEAFKAGILGPEGGRDMDYSMKNAQDAPSYGPYQISYPAHKKALLEKYGVENEAELAYGTVGRLGVDGMTADEIQEGYMDSLVEGYETGANNYYDSLSDVEKRDLQKAGIGKSEYMSIAHFRGNGGAKDYAGSVTTQMAAGVPYNPKAAFGNYAENPGAPIGYDEQANPIYSGDNANNMLAGDYAQRFGEDYDANLQSRGLSRYDINSPDGLDMFGGARQDSPISLDPIQPQPLDVPNQEPTMGQFRPQSSIGLTPMPGYTPNSNQSLRTQSGREYQTSPTLTPRGLPGGIPNPQNLQLKENFAPPLTMQELNQSLGFGPNLATQPGAEPPAYMSEFGVDQPQQPQQGQQSMGPMENPNPNAPNWNNPTQPPQETPNWNNPQQNPIAATPLVTPPVNNNQVTASNDGSGAINPAWMQTIQNRMGITANADGSPVSTTDPLAAIGNPGAEGQGDSAKLPWQLYAANAIPGLMNVGKGLFGTAPTMELEREQNQDYRNFNPIMNNYSQMQGRGLALGRAGLQGSGATGAQLRGGYQAMNSGAQAQAGQFMNQLSPQIEQSRRATDRFNQGVMSRNQQRTLMEDQFAMQNDPANSLSKGIGQLVNSGTNLYMDNLKAQNIGTQMYDMFGKFIGNKDS